MLLVQKNIEKHTKDVYSAFTWSNKISWVWNFGLKMSQEPSCFLRIPLVSLVSSNQQEIKNKGNKDGIFCELNDQFGSALCLAFMLEWNKVLFYLNLFRHFLYQTKQWKTKKSYHYPKEVAAIHKQINKAFANDQIKQNRKNQN